RTRSWTRDLGRVPPGVRIPGDWFVEAQRARAGRPHRPGADAAVALARHGDWAPLAGELLQATENGRTKVIRRLLLARGAHPLGEHQANEMLVGAVTASGQVLGDVGEVCFAQLAVQVLFELRFRFIATAIGHFALLIIRG